MQMQALCAARHGTRAPYADVMFHKTHWQFMKVAATTMQSKRPVKARG